MSVSFNRQPALEVTLMVSDPRPPFLACGGIIGFVAQNPNDAEKDVTLPGHWRALRKIHDEPALTVENRMMRVENIISVKSE